MQFSLANLLVTSAIPGANFPHQMRQSIDTFTQTIPEAFRLELREKNLIRPDAPIPSPSNNNPDRPKP
jgi:D-threo-aldose 1-dehydrogenase